jgi:CRP-like cAMP-binding protein
MKGAVSVRKSTISTHGSMRCSNAEDLMKMSGMKAIVSTTDSLDVNPHRFEYDSDRAFEKSQILSKAPPMKEINRLEKGDYFGERALITEEARTATVVALEQVECLTLSRAAFLRLMGPLQSISDRTSNQYGEFVLRSIPLFKNLTIEEVAVLTENFFEVVFLTGITLLL